VKVERGRAVSFSRALRAWFRQNGRDLPWRRTRDPYRVLVSEAMLQQTQVARVVNYYDRFLTRFPTLEALAEAPPRLVRESWEGLGYYARARNLHALSRRVRELPDDPAALEALPGIGRYTAGAVASFAFEKRAALVDTNVARVLRRVFAPRASFRTSRGQKKLWAIAESVLPRTGRSTWEHNQAIMELGALVCTARVARCMECPVARMCRSSRRSKQRDPNRWNCG
jgi:A/G-specific adenine glycosylase